MLLDSCPFGACVLTPKLEVRFWNQCLEQWTGVRREELLGTDLSLRYQGLRQPDFYQPIQAVSAGGQSKVLVEGAGFPIVEDKGLVIKATASALPREGRDQHDILLSLEDITELKEQVENVRTLKARAEDSLRESEERFRLMVDSAPVMLWLSGPDGRFSFFNKQWLEFTGRRLEDELGYGWMAGLDDEDRDKHWHLYATSVHARQIFETEFRLRRADGSFRWILNQGVPRYTPERRFTGYIGSCFDITERKETELALARFREVMNHSGAAIFITDSEEGRLVDVNDTACRWLGRSYDEMLDLRAQDFEATLNLHVHDTWSETAEELRWKTRRAVERPHLFKETFHRRRDGSTFPVEILVSRKEFQNQEYLLVVARDVTERKRAESSLKESEGKLRQLTRHLHEVREEERKRIAREIHDELGQTLTALKLDLSWSAGRVDSQEMAERMSNLVDHAIATVQRISADLRPQVLDDLGLIAALEWHAQQFTKPIGIECHFHSEVESVVLSPERATHVFRIFQETLTNVARHAEATRVEVQLSKTDGCLVLKVEDNGKGVSNEEIARANSFGLMGMHERARLCEGELQIDGTPGEGTRITVTLPVSQ